MLPCAKREILVCRSLLWKACLEVGAVGSSLLSGCLVPLLGVVVELGAETARYLDVSLRVATQSNAASPQGQRPRTWDTRGKGAHLSSSNQDRLHCAPVRQLTKSHWKRRGARWNESNYGLSSRTIRLFDFLLFLGDWHQPSGIGSAN